MSGIKRKKCCNCKDLFKTEPQSLAEPCNAKRQKYCRKASKAAGQGRWLAKPENQGYFSGPKNVKRVQLWREDNPGYWRGKRKTGELCSKWPEIAAPRQEFNLDNKTRLVYSSYYSYL